MSRLASFSQPIHALVVGGRGGLGGALVAALAGDPAVARVIATTRSRTTPADDDRVRWRTLEVALEAGEVMTMGRRRAARVIAAGGSWPGLPVVAAPEPAPRA